MKNDLKLLFSLGRDDFEWQYFTIKGKGGQHVNRSKSGVRCTHPPSGAVGEGRDTREQTLNKRTAFTKCVKTKEFQAWHAVEVARRLGKLKHIETAVEAAVDRAMAEHNLKVEYV